MDAAYRPLAAPLAAVAGLLDMALPAAGFAAAAAGFPAVGLAAAGFAAAGLAAGGCFETAIPSSMEEKLLMVGNSIGDFLHSAIKNRIFFMDFFDELD